MTAAELVSEARGAGVPAVVQPPAWGPPADYLRLTLVPLLDGVRVVTYDARNTGGSIRTGAGPIELETLVADLDAIRERHGFDRFLLLGHSHGGWVAMAYAVRHPRRLLGLALLNTALETPGITPEVEAILEQYDDDPRRREALRWFRRRRRPEDLRDDRELALWVRRTMAVRFHDLEAMARFQRRLVGTPPPSLDALRAAPGMGEAPWVREGLARVTAPALVVAGRHDPTTPPSEAERIAGLLPRSRLVVFERSGHNPWAEEPRRFARVMARFVREARFAASPPVG